MRALLPILLIAFMLAACGAPDGALRATLVPYPTNAPATPGPSPTPLPAYPAPYPAPAALVATEARLPVRQYLPSFR